MGGGGGGRGGVGEGEEKGEGGGGGEGEGHVSPDVFMLEESGEPREESLRCCNIDASILGGRERETLGPGGTMRVGLESRGF